MGVISPNHHMRWPCGKEGSNCSCSCPSFHLSSRQHPTLVSELWDCSTALPPSGKGIGGHRQILERISCYSVLFHITLVHCGPVRTPAFNHPLSPKQKKWRPWNMGTSGSRETSHCSVPGTNFRDNTIVQGCETGIRTPDSEVRVSLIHCISCFLLLWLKKKKTQAQNQLGEERIILACLL